MISSNRGMLLSLVNAIGLMSIPSNTLSDMAIRSRSLPAGFKLRNRSKYRPHQGKQECARRLRQLAKLRAV